jgi:DNA adenine methylase
VSDALRAPFPYFGGKRRVAEPVWAALGPNINNYVEPFFGSGAVLLGRPGGAGKIETVNDRDRMLSNFWRAIVADPWAVAEWADSPVMEADMHAWHCWLVQQLAPGSSFIESMHTDPFFYDPMIAGRWVHGQCAWIGSGWCVEPQNHKHPKLDGMGKGVHSDTGHGKERNGRARTRPRMSGTNAGEGVHSRLPRIGGGQAGVHRAAEHSPRGRRGNEADHRKRPELDGTSPGRGVHSDGAHDPKRQLPMLSVGNDGGAGAPGRGVHGAEAYSPGRRPALSTAGEHEMPATWTEHAWKGARGYATEDNDNREKERIWFSPHCLGSGKQQELFGRTA